MTPISRSLRLRLIVLLLPLLAGSCLFAGPAGGQCVLTNVPCPPTPPAQPVGRGGGGSSTGTSGGHGALDEYFEKKNEAHDLYNQAANASNSGNHRLALELYSQAERLHDSKENRAAIVHQNGFLAWENGDFRTALADFLQTQKMCGSCYKKTNLQELIAKLQKYFSDVEAAAAEVARQKQQEEQDRAAAGQRAAASVAAMRSEVEQKIAAEQSAAEARRRQQIAEAGKRTQGILDGSLAQQKITAQKNAAGPLLAANSSNAFFGSKAADPHDPNAPFHISGSTETRAASSGSDTNAMRSLKSATGNSTEGAAAGPGDTEADRGKDLTGKTLDTPGAAKDPNLPTVLTPHAERVLTPEQEARLQTRLAHNADYQRLLAEHGQAVKDATKARQALDAVTAKYAAMPDGPAKNQAAVEVANASQEVSRTSNAVVANEKNQDILKEAEVEITILPAKSKVQHAEPPVPGAPPPTAAPGNPAAGPGAGPGAGR